MQIKRPPSKQPLPTHAKKVFSGILFDVYQWEQTLYNGEKALFEKIGRTDTVSVVPVTTDGKIILSTQEQPGTESFTGAFGGKIDPGETPLEAAKRELLEETGYVAGEYVLWEAIQPIEKIDWAIYIFIAKGCKQVAQQQFDAGEKISLQFVSFETFIKASRQENFRDAEITLKFARIIHDSKKLAETKKLFLA